MSAAGAEYPTAPVYVPGWSPDDWFRELAETAGPEVTVTGRLVATCASVVSRHGHDSSMVIPTADLMREIGRVAGYSRLRVTSGLGELVDSGWLAYVDPDRCRLVRPERSDGGIS